MKILYILSDGPSALSSRVIELQSRGGETRIIDLSKRTESYESIVDEIASCDRLVSW